MLPRAKSGLLVACSLLGSMAIAGDPTGLYQGTAHDALYGLCLNDQQGIAVGSAGLIVESADGGQTWNPQQPFTGSALLGISCGEGPRLIVAQGGHIYRWDGQSYQSVDSGTDARLLGVDANADGLAFAVGGFGAVLRSTDGGQNWESIGFDWEAILNDFLEPHLYAVDVSAQGVITMVGEFELVLRSVDGGDSWDTVHKGEASLFGLDLRADGGGFAVGQEGRVLSTSDGGISWTEVPTPTNAILLDAWSAPGGDVLVTGIRTVLRSSDAGLSWTQVVGGDINVGWYQGLSVPSNDAASAGVALLAGHRGSIIKLQLN
jgi:photosystem II stability/assembly factor-like uncharacterized protein